MGNDMSLGKADIVGSSSLTTLCFNLPHDYTLTIKPTADDNVFGVGSGDTFSIGDSVGTGNLVVTGSTTKLGGVIFNNKGPSMHPA